MFSFIAGFIAALAAALLFGAILGADGDYTLGDEDAVSAITGFFYFVAWFAYYWWGNATGRSLGKRIMGLKVVLEKEASAPGWGRGLGRTIGYLISALPLGLGYLWAVWDSDKQAWHDKMVGTIVVRA